MASSDLITIRLDPTARTRLRRAARRRGLTTSASVRLAIQAWLAVDAASADSRPYEELADLVGCVELPLDATKRAAPKRRLRRGGSR